ncbi:MAG: hypothetical protein ACWA5T_05990 [Parvularcula sp.]
MGKTESIFAGILLAAVGAAVLLVVFRGGGGILPDGGNSWSGSNAEVFGGFTGEERNDLCTCYEQAYSYGTGNLSIESLEYRGGFAECSRRLGKEGGRAWTDGWANGERAPGTPRTCRAWFADRR